MASNCIFLILKFDFGLQEYFPFKYTEKRDVAEDFVNVKNNSRLPEYRVKKIEKIEGEKNRNKIKKSAVKK